MRYMILFMFCIIEDPVTVFLFAAFRESFMTALSIKLGITLAYLSLNTRELSRPNSFTSTAASPISQT
jgi:hypothetical protein